MKTTSKIISMMLVAVMLCTGFAFAATAPADVAGTDCETAVNALIEAGAVTGDGDDGLYHPNDNLTRAQACIIIVKSINPTSASVNGTATQLPGIAAFPDMKGYGWAENYIVYSVNNGIVKGYPDGTFKPGNNVSVPEMAAMLLRGAKLITDESTMKYPDDYMTLAVEKGILTADQLTQTGAATKGMAAQMTYAVLPQLQAAFTVPSTDDTAQGTDKDTASTVPSTTGMTFGSASFDANTTTFGGKTIAKNATIYTYGKAADYAADMKMSTNKNDYLENTVYLYKNVTTKAWYKVENGKITSMILPKDVGFSGLVSCVVNGTIATLNYAGEKVTGIESMTATHPITWLTKSNLDMAAYTDVEGDGQVYELSTTNGEVRKMSTTTGAKSKNFKELTSGTYTEVFDYDDRVVTLTDASGVKFEVAENATVYVWDDKDKEYNQGRLGSIKAGKQIRAYQLTDEGSVASIVVIDAD